MDDLFGRYLISQQKPMTGHFKTGPSTTNSNHMLVIVVSFLLLTITVLIAFGFFVVEKNQRTVSPLKTTVHRIQIETEEVHQWIQNMLANPSHSNIEFLWFQLDLSVAEFRQMIEGDDGSPEIEVSTELNRQLIFNLKRLVEDITDYKMFVRRILNPGAQPEEAFPDGIDYESAYNAILARLEEMEDPIDLFLQKDILFFRNLMIVGVITCLLLSAMLAMTFGRFLKQKAADYIALNAANEKLKHELTERNRVEASLRQSEQLFRTVFETSPDAIVITRIEDNVIIDINLGFTAYTGYDREEVVGRSVLDIELWQDVDQRKALLDEVYAKGFALDWEAVFCTKYVGLITCLLSTKKLEINGMPHILTVVRDISDRKLYEARIQAANKFLNIGNRHTQMQPLLREFVEETKVVSGCAAVAIRILDADGSIPYVASDGFDSDFCNLKEPLSVHSNKGMCARVINNHRWPHESFFTTYGSYYINSTSTFLASASEDQKQVMRNTCHRYGYETIALIPIRSRDRARGLIHVADREANRLSEKKIEILEAAALQLVTAIERVQAEQALKDSYDELEKRVDERTEMLLQTKDKLVLEVKQREKYEHELLGFQQRLRELSSRLIQTEERERRRLALEIHDRIGQTLAVTKMQLGAIQAEFDFEDLKKKIEEIRDLISLTIRDVRTLTFDLSPPILYELGLQAALEWLAESIHKQSGLVVEVAVDGSKRNLDADRRVLLFRTCNELLLNVVKHAAAKHARVDISTCSEMIKINISDDGVGFEQTVLENGFDPVERGFGLFSIREQLQHYGGTFEIASVPNRGSAVTIALPLPNTTETEKRNSS